MRKRRLVPIAWSAFLFGAAAVFAQDAPSQPTTPPPQLSAGRDGFSWNSSDGAFVLKLRGYIQFDGRFFDGAAGSETFLMRRVRPIL
ncbi:MAG TPA: hypothetical protein VLE54_08395, partial [Thermoanaerobaculia bacterium]|nr:hypothetical protein [Thermoanaerobaculia bacterium]